jgi:hypothetical protein
MLIGEEEKKEDDGYDGEENSLAKPTFEELQAWQESQFKKGKQTLEIKKQLKMTFLQRRRDLKKVYGGSDEEEEEDKWEQVAALPDLDGQTLVFFPSLDEKGNKFLGVHPLLQQFAQGDQEILGTKRLRLFLPAEGCGLSFHNLLNTLKGYGGPTVILIGTVPSASRSLKTAEQKRTTIGFYTTSPWSESTDLFGSDDCFLFAFDEQDNAVNSSDILELQSKKNFGDFTTALE